MIKIKCCLTCGEEIPAFKWFCCPEHEAEHCELLNKQNEKEEVA